MVGIYIHWMKIVCAALNALCIQHPWLLIKTKQKTINYVCMCRWPVAGPNKMYIYLFNQWLNSSFGWKTTLITENIYPICTHTNSHTTKAFYINMHDTFSGIILSLFLGKIYFNENNKMPYNTKDLCEKVFGFQWCTFLLAWILWMAVWEKRIKYTCVEQNLYSHNEFITERKNEKGLKGIQHTETTKQV